MDRIGVRLMTFQRDWDALTPRERDFALLDQIGDGTDLYDYYYWQVGVGAKDLPDAARRIGAPQAAGLIERANALFPARCIEASTNGGATSVYLDDHEVDFAPLEAEFATINAEGLGPKMALERFARRHLDVFPELVTVDGEPPSLEWAVSSERRNIHDEQS